MVNQAYKLKQLKNPELPKPNSTLESKNLHLKENSFILKKSSYQKLVFKKSPKRTLQSLLLCHGQINHWKPYGIINKAFYDLPSVIRFKKSDFSKVNI